MNDVIETLAMGRKASQEAIKAVLALEDENGQVDFDKLIDASKDEDSPTHPYFTWDDSLAGLLLRREEARRLVTQVKLTVRVEDHSVETVRYVGTGTAQRGTRFVNITRLSKDESLTLLEGELKRILGNVERTIGIARAKAGGKTNQSKLMTLTVGELTGVLQTLERLLAQVKGLQ